MTSLLMSMSWHQLSKEQELPSYRFNWENAGIRLGISVFDMEKPEWHYVGWCYSEKVSIRPQIGYVVVMFHHDELGYCWFHYSFTSLDGKTIIVP